MNVEDRIKICERRNTRGYNSVDRPQFYCMEINIPKMESG